MNLIVDIGNTNTKLAVYDGSSKFSTSRLSEISCEELERVLTGYEIKKAIVSSVKKLPPFVSDLFFSKIPFVHFLSYKSTLPFKIEYETPETLGADRIAAAAGACEHFPGAEILIIDAGTAITFDLVLSGVFKGGNISPGLTMRFKSLNSLTDGLPLLSISDNFSFPGRNTTDAIIAGVVTGVTYEINEYIRTFKKKNAGLKIILTGGDAGYLMDKISYKVEYIPDIVIDGLNYILENNAT